MTANAGFLPRNLTELLAQRRWGSCRDITRRGHPAYGACRGGSVVVRRYTVAVLWRGDQEQRHAATPYNNRYRRVFEELMALGTDAQPAVYADDIAALVREQLLKADGVLVSVDPIHEAGLVRSARPDAARRGDARSMWPARTPTRSSRWALRRITSHETSGLWDGRFTFTDQWPISFARHFPRTLRNMRPGACRLKQNRPVETVASGVWSG